MQLRKICNHPDLLEPRPINSPVMMSAIPLVLHSEFMRKKGPFDCIADNGGLCFWGDDLSLEHICGAEECNTNYESNVDCWQRKINVENELRYRRNILISNRRCTKPCIRIARLQTSFIYVKRFIDDVIDILCNPKRQWEISPCWKCLVLSIQTRLEQLTTVIENFVFVLPKVVSIGPKTYYSGHILDDTRFINSYSPVMTTILREMSFMYAVKSRQSIFFPDKKLVQYDSGKLRMLSKLLRNLKHGGHKCLIFTQMSKMLDILELFLNLNGYQYVRLDGSTSIDQRQKLMDRFNSDPKLFCFILSTRSGGLGINLTGADSVIFYDTDWNPAMDAQAQDRAHRIGQTREVHIYRMVTESSVEENILLKAKQKKQLDLLVMDRGNFAESSLLSMNSIKNMLGIEDNSGNQSLETHNLNDMENLMTAVEDEEDVVAMKKLQVEKLV